MKRLFLAAAVLLTVVSTAHAQPPAAFQKVMIVVLENTDYANALAQPFLSDLAAHGALLGNFFAETHPSFPNYVAMTAGSTFRLSSNDEVTLDVSHIGDLLEAAGRTWKVYAEGYPGNCFLDSTAGAYVRRHVPFLSFRNVQTNPARCQQVVNAAVLATDIANGTRPDYGFYVPDLNNDGHDTGVAFADHWLAQTFGPWLEDPRFMDGMLFVVTFDEGSSSGPNHIYTVLYGHAVVPGSVSASRYDHYSLLRTIEDAWALGTLGQQDAEASAITEVWRRTHTLTVTSVNPSAVAVAVNPMDLDRWGDGTTPFNRIYDHNALVSLTASATAGGNTFQKWQRDGVDFATSPSVQVTVDANHALTAVYAFVPTIRAAVLPLSRSVQVGGGPATAFAAIVNTGSTTATNCAPAGPSSPPVGLGVLTYQTTTPANALSGTPNTPVNIAAGAIQNYVFGFLPTAAVLQTSLAIQFLCDNAGPAPQVPGVNNFFVVASTSPVPDTVALMATLSADGVVRIPGSASTQLFAIGTSNVGATGTIVVSGDTGGVTLPLTLTICETGPRGACLAPPTPTVTVNYLAGTNRSFAFFAQASGSIAFDPATNRVFARLTQAGVLRGATSAAVCTSPNAGC